jgi:SPX domain protein involved in polyphosphate accumulation
MIILKSPSNKLYRILEEDLIHFARIHKLNFTSLKRVVNKLQKSTEGWRLPDDLDILFPDWGE